MEPKDWKDHPVIILAGTFAAGITFAIVIITPIYVEQLKAEIAEQESKSSGVNDAYTKLNEAEKRIAYLSSRLYTLSQKNPIEKGNPYPAGMDYIKIGDAKNKIMSTYTNIKEYDDDNVIVYFDGGMFDSAWYGLDKGIVTSVSFSCGCNTRFFGIKVPVCGRHKEQSEELFWILVGAFGNPEKSSSKAYSWSLPYQGISYSVTYLNWNYFMQCGYSFSQLH